MSHVKSIVNSRCVLGEGPLWVPESLSLFWVDIKRCLLFCLNTKTNQVSQWHFDDAITSIVEKQSGGFFGTSIKGFVDIDLISSKLSLKRSPESDIVGNRHNDAKVDPFGNLWSGTMDDSEKDLTGRLYRLDKDGNFEIKDSGYCVTNGPTFSPDGNKLYHTDTFLRKIYQYDLTTSGGLTNRETFVHFEERDGYPDGMTTDAEGHIWVCHFGGHMISRYAPTGELVKRYPMPCPNITSCAFGGENLDELYITTATWTLNEETVEQFPVAGNLLKMKTDTQGMLAPKYAG